MPLMSKTIVEKRTRFKIKLGIFLLVLGGILLLIHFSVGTKLNEMLPGTAVLSYHQATYQGGIILFLGGIILACFNMYIMLDKMHLKRDELNS